MFWKKLIFINASFFGVILKLLSIYLKEIEQGEARVNKTFSLKIIYNNNKNFNFLMNCQFRLMK